MENGGAQAQGSWLGKILEGCLEEVVFLEEFSLGDLWERRLSLRRQQREQTREVQELCPGGGWPPGYQEAGAGHS